MSHTKGPWINYKGLICQANNLGIARIVSSGTEKDAHLIAAAPEMLEALERIEVLLSAHKDSDYQFMLTMIRPAIDKARGEK